MSKQFDTAMRGTLWRNKAMRGDKRDPNYTGTAEVDGVIYYMDAWENTPKAGGDTFLSVRFKEKVGKPGLKITDKAVEQSYTTKSAATDDSPFDDEIPF